MFDKNQRKKITIFQKELHKMKIRSTITKEP